MKEFTLLLYSYFLITEFLTTQPPLLYIVPSASVILCTCRLAKEVLSSFVFCSYLAPLAVLCRGDGDTLKTVIKLVK